MSGEEGARGGVERRQGPREQVTPAGLAVSVVGAQIVNLSAHGVMVDSLLPMEADTVMPLRLVVSGVKQDVRARVVRCQPLPGAKRRYRIGLEFVDPSPELREELAQLVREGSGLR